MLLRERGIFSFGIPAGTPVIALGVGLGALGMISTQAAFGGFVGGVEHFEGTVKDTATWQEYVSNGEVIIQNNALTIADPQGTGIKTGDYTTREVKVLPGNSLSARVTLNAAGLAELYLTTNSAGATSSTAFDSYWAQLEIGASQTQGGISRWIGANGGSNQGADLALVSNPIGQTFEFEIVRPNSTDYIFRAYDAQDALLGSNTYLGSTPHPEGLFISMQGINGSTATWDDVTVRIIPEPSPLGTIVGIGLLLSNRLALHRHPAVDR